MIPFFPKQIATKAIYLYLGVLAAVSIFFIRHAMSIEYIIMGIAWVAGFFLLSNYCSQKWEDIPQKQLLRNLFLTALGLRIFWVFFAYLIRGLRPPSVFRRPFRAFWYSLLFLSGG